jgi:hypothetical protein
MYEVQEGGGVGCEVVNESYSRTVTRNLAHQRNVEGSQDQWVVGSL